ncbi:MAG: site-specific DNA-methyltransferase [Ignavibacteriae bacterium]|nr:site-specific DNA-methyltransferase [Ignavibacteriota bacterium]NOG97640.1 site-specific DNA-methyltransferase [Ignavibacteriota bacterium]
MKIKAPRNKTIDLSDEEIKKYKSELISVNNPVKVENIINKTILGDLFNTAAYLPKNMIDLLILDPPYNLNKKFNSTKFKSKTKEDYSEWLQNIVQKLVPLLKEDSSIYICGDWFTSASIFPVIGKYFEIRNRITWEREKGRGAKMNWKNNYEDIWFCTMGSSYTFNVDAVKIKRKVIAPYKSENGEPKDWSNDKDGKFRITHPSNIWTDISIPFWSMPENTIHPTQKPEKLIAKIILASSNEGDLVFDPFLGSGTTSVAAKKLNRSYVGIEIDEYFACLSEKRLKLAEQNKSIQGYSEGVFWERNTFSERKILKDKPD